MVKLALFLVLNACTTPPTVAPVEPCEEGMVLDAGECVEPCGSDGPCGDDEECVETELELEEEDGTYSIFIGRTCEPVA